MDNLATLSPSGKPPKSRITSAQKAYQIWGTLLQADYQSALQRARVDAMYDGKQPYDQCQLDATGQGFRTNTDHGFAASLLETALSGYLDVNNASETFFECPTTYGIPEERREWEKIMAEEITATIRDWDDYDDTELSLITAFIKHGVGIACFNDEYDWRYYATDLSDFKIPRKTKVGQSNIDVGCCLRFYSPTDLYNMIKDPEKAKTLGYNVEACRKAIMQCMQNGQNFIGYSNYDWEKIEIEIKNNDLFFANGTADAQSIRVIMMWVQEYAQKGEAHGRVSQYMLLDDNQVSEFLYQKVGRFRSVYEAYTVFTFGVGNKYYHGIRGQGYKIFEQVQALNRLWCQAMDGAMLSSSVMVQPQSEDDATELQLAYYGPFSILPSNLNVVEKASLPNIYQSVFPAIQGFAQQLRDKTGSYNVQSFLDDNREKTKFQIQAELGAIAKMSISALNLYYNPKERQLREIVRRMKRKSYNAEDPGGSYVVELRKRLKQRNVPLEAFYNLDIDRLKIVKAVGAGSEAARLLAFDRAMQVFGQLDDTGKQNIIRDFLAEFFGYRNVGRYVPNPNGEGRPTLDVSIAELQNDALLSGGVATVKPNDNQLAHADVHMSALIPVLEQAEQILAAPPEVLAQSLPQAMQLMQGLNALTQHTSEHVARLSQDPMMKEQSAALRKQLQNADEILHNGLLKLQRLQSQAPQGEEPQVDPKVLQDLEINRLKREQQLETDYAKAQQQMVITQQKAAQQLAIKDAEAAQKLRYS